MNRIKSLLYIVLFVAILFLCGCYKDKYELPAGTTESDCFVQVYIEPKNFELRLPIGIDENLIVGHFTGETFEWGSSDAKFYEYAKYFNDLSYNDKVVPWSNQALTEPLTSVKIVCDKDFDASHKAGSDLGDVIMFCATSPYEFIQRGYKGVVYTYPDYWEWFSLNQGIGYKPIEIWTKDVNKNNTRMIYPIFYFYFMKRPTQRGEYLFTVTINTKDTEMVKQIYYTF